MKEILREMILDFQNEPAEPSVRRLLEYELVSRKAFICIGVRQCGKTTFLHQIIEDLLKKGIPIENILYINFFDDRLQPLEGKLDLVLEAYFSIYPEKKAREKIYCFFDEIQDVAGWEPFVDRIMRAEKCEVFISGSSARLLSTEIATQMRGRGIAWELFPFSFAEFLNAKNIDTGKMTSRTRLIIAKAFDEYWEIGGFPEVLTASVRVRTKIHQEYLHTILYRDIIERHDVRHPLALADAARWLLHNAGSHFSINRLTAHLRGNNHPVNKETVGSYVAWLQDAYFLFGQKILNASLAVQNANPRKSYCVDHALLHSVCSTILVNRGHTLENMIFVHLRRQGIDTCYHRTKSEREVDFVWIDRLRRKHLVQVCYSLADPATKDRELKALFQAMEELSVLKATIVTYDDTGEERHDGRCVEAVPAWRFMLESETF